MERTSLYGSVLDSRSYLNDDIRDVWARSAYERWQSSLTFITKVKGQSSVLNRLTFPDELGRVKFANGVPQLGDRQTQTCTLPFEHQFASIMVPYSLSPLFPSKSKRFWDKELVEFECLVRSVCEASTFLLWIIDSGKQERRFPFLSVFCYPFE